MSLPFGLYRNVSNNPRLGTCFKCDTPIPRGDPYQKAFGAHPQWLAPSSRWPFKLCKHCVLPPSEGVSREEMRALKKAIRVSASASQVSAVASAVPSAVPLCFYGEKDSDGNRYRFRHPFSNFSEEDIKIAGVTERIGSFRCSGDGQVAFILTRIRVSGSRSKALGRMIEGLDKVKWKKKTQAVARYVTQVKYAQCPEFKKSVRAVRGRPVYECSKDAVWGTGTALGEPIGSGTNYLGAAITELTTAYAPSYAPRA